MCKSCWMRYEGSLSDLSDSSHFFQGGCTPVAELPPPCVLDRKIVAGRVFVPPLSRGVPFLVGYP